MALDVSQPSLPESVSKWNVAPHSHFCTRCGTHLHFASMHTSILGSLSMTGGFYNFTGPILKELTGGGDICFSWNI